LQESRGMCLKTCAGRASSPSAPLEYAQPCTSVPGQESVCRWAIMRAKQSGRMELLHFAARDGEFDLVRSMLDAGVDVNEPAENQWTPLHYAAEAGHVFVVELLLKRGADVEARTAEGYTPLDVAAVYEQSSVAELLRRHGRPRRPGR